MQASHLDHCAKGALSALRKQVIGNKYMMKVAGMTVAEMVTPKIMEVTVSDMSHNLSPDFNLDLGVGVAEHPEYVHFVLKCPIRYSDLVGKPKAHEIAEVLYKAMLDAFNEGFKAIPDTELAGILYDR